MEQMTARRRLTNAQDIYDHACTQVVNRKRSRAHQLRRISLMLYVMPKLEKEAALEQRDKIKADIKAAFTGVFDGMARDILDTYMPNTLRK
jgi:uncharacterized membrane protein YeiH